MRNPTALIRTAAALLVVVTFASTSAAVSGPPPLDRYGGVAVRVAEPTGYFQVKKIGNRWVFVTPEGNAFWMLGVFNVTVTGSIDDLKDSQLNRVRRKYGDLSVWGVQTARRLKAWGFNTTAEYSSHYVRPTRSPYGPWENPEKLAFNVLVRVSYYGFRNQGNYAPGPFKDLITGTDPAVYTGWRGNTTPDVFDPNFDAYVDGFLRNEKELRSALNSPWLIGITIDDADNIVGFGPGPEIPAPRLHPHIGWIVLVTAFQQSANQRIGVTYPDPKVYSKIALRDFLKSKYRNIAALNKAWGATYTTFDSDGGWPSGSGLLDESGRNKWVGTDYGRLRTATPAVAADLDAFLYEYAKKYFSVTTGRVRQHAPKHLVIGPATFNGWDGLTRKEILRAAGEYLDVLQATTRSREVLDLTAKYAGDIPLIGWTGMVANADSALWRYPYQITAEMTPILRTQQERGRTYANQVLDDFNATTSGGVKPIVGIKLWSYTDSWGEKANWGLVSFLDNAYDGREAVRRSGADSWGFPTGGEERDYGDFISAARQTNQAVLEHLRDELKRSNNSRKAGR